MKTRKLFTILLLWLMAVGMQAQNAITVYQKDGQVAKFAFAEKPVVTYSVSELVLTTTKTVVQYPIYMLQKIAFDVDDLIDDIGKMELPQTQFGFHNGKLSIIGGEAGSVVSLYTIHGMMIGQYRLDDNGNATITLDLKGKDIYIVKTKQLSFKIRKS